MAKIQEKTGYPDFLQPQIILIFTDDNVQDAMVVAAFLESSILEEKCLDHLAVKSNFTMAEQIKLAEALNSTKLLVRF